MYVHGKATNNIVLKALSDSADGSLPKSPPEGIPSGIFLHYVNDQWLPLLAEGVVWYHPAVRNPAAQTTISGSYNEREPKLMDASHLIPRTLGGSGEAYNLVPLPAHFNKKLIRDFEHTLEGMARREPHYLQVFVTYDGDREVPREVTYRFYRMSHVQVLGLAIPSETFWISH